MYFIAYVCTDVISTSAYMRSISRRSRLPSDSVWVPREMLVSLSYVIQQNIVRVIALT